MQTAFAYWLLTVLSAGIAAFVGAYLKQKAQNLATHEDIQNLVQQVEATTAATKAIEGRISDEFWNKQRVWEMKRDISLGLLANARLMQEAISELNVRVNMLERYQEGTVERRETMRQKLEILEKWNSASNSFHSRRNEASIFCSRDVVYAAANISTNLIEWYDIALTGKITDFGQLGKNWQVTLQPLYAAIQKELGISNS